MAVAELRRLWLLSRIAADRVIFVRGEKGLDFRPVAEVIDIANGAGMNRVAPDDGISRTNVRTLTTAGFGS